MQVTYGFVFGSARALGILWQLDLRTGGLSDGRVSFVFLKGIAAYTLAAYKRCLCGCVAWLQYSGVLPGRIVIKTTLLIVFHAKGLAALEIWWAISFNLMQDEYSMEVTACCSDCWSVWRRQGLQAKVFSSHPCLQWKWQVASVSAQDLKTTD